MTKEQIKNLKVGDYFIDPKYTLYLGLYEIIRTDACLELRLAYSSITYTYSTDVLEWLETCNFVYEWWNLKSFVIKK